jgi:hypothetical protein
MPTAAFDGKNRPTRGRLLLAGAVVVLTIVAAWKFIDYRMQPPPPPPQAVTSDK